MNREPETQPSGRNPEMPNRHVDDEAARKQIRKAGEVPQSPMPDKTPGSAEGPLEEPAKK